MSLKDLFVVDEAFIGTGKLFCYPPVAIPVVVEHNPLDEILDFHIRIRCFPLVSPPVVACTAQIKELTHTGDREAFFF
jgi:hypothetical protein